MSRDESRTWKANERDMMLPIFQKLWAALESYKTLDDGGHLAVTTLAECQAQMENVGLRITGIK